MVKGRESASGTELINTLPFHDGQAFISLFVNRNKNVQFYVQSEMSGIRYLKPEPCKITRYFHILLFPVLGEPMVEGISAKSSHYSCRKNFFLGNATSEVHGRILPKKVFPARIMHLAESPGTIK
jgi:hypothetical protein